MKTTVFAIKNVQQFFGSYKFLGKPKTHNYSQLFINQFFPGYGEKK